LGIFSYFVVSTFVSSDFRFARSLGLLLLLLLLLHEHTPPPLGWSGGV
jgi:hypothetical protein